MTRERGVPEGGGRRPGSPAGARAKGHAETGTSPAAGAAGGTSRNRRGEVPTAPGDARTVGDDPASGTGAAAPTGPTGALRQDPPTAEPPGMDLIHLLRRVTVGLDMHGAEFAARNGLHPTDLRALIHLLDAARSGAVVPPGSLGAELGLNSAGTTALIDRLENPGLIRRDRDVNDRRRVLIRVEPAAVTLGTSFFGPLIARVLAVADTFGDDEIAVVTRFLTEVSRTVEDARAAPPARS